MLNKISKVPWFNITYDFVKYPSHSIDKRNNKADD